MHCEHEIFKFIERTLLEITSKEISEVREELPLSDYIVNSIEFIKLFVEIEENYDISFDEDELEPELFPDIRHLVKTIDKKIKDA